MVRAPPRIVHVGAAAFQNLERQTPALADARDTLALGPTIAGGVAGAVAEAIEAAEVRVLRGGRQDERDDPEQGWAEPRPDDGTFVPFNQHGCCQLAVQRAPRTPSAISTKSCSSNLYGSATTGRYVVLSVTGSSSSTQSPMYSMPAADK